MGPRNFEENIIDDYNIIISVEFIVKFIIEIIDYKAVEETNIDSRRKSKRSSNKNSKYYNKDFISNDNDNVIDETNISIWCLVYNSAQYFIWFFLFQSPIVTTTLSGLIYNNNNNYY